MAHDSDSSTQRQAESVLIKFVAKELNVDLRPATLTLGSGATIQVDGASSDLSILVEAWAHQGAPRGAQSNKVLGDATKLWLAARPVEGRNRLILVLADELAARPFTGRSWRAAANAEMGDENLVAPLDGEMRRQIRSAQTRQFR